MRTWPSRASCSPGAWTVWAPSGSPTSIRASRRRSRTTCSASRSAQLLLVLYYAWLTDPMQNIIVTGMQVTSVFLPTAIAALLFPYMKRCKSVWDSSPYNDVDVHRAARGRLGRARRTSSIWLHPALLLHLQRGRQAVHLDPRSSCSLRCGSPVVPGTTSGSTSTRPGRASTSLWLIANCRPSDGSAACIESGIVWNGGFLAAVPHSPR